MEGCCILVEERGRSSVMSACWNCFYGCGGRRRDAEGVAKEAPTSFPGLGSLGCAWLFVGEHLLFFHSGTGNRTRPSEQLDMYDMC